MQLAEIGRRLESLVPHRLAEEWDRVGWMLAPLSDELSGILICVDPSPAAFEEAEAKNCNLIIAHHPLFFNPVDGLVDDEPFQNLIIQAVKSSCGVYAMHTNADSCRGGLNDLFADYLCLQETHALIELENEHGAGLGRVGELETMLSGRELEEKIMAHKHINYMRSTLCPEREIKRVALCTGSGGDLIENKKVQEADVFISGDIKHHQVETARLHGLDIIIVDHYEMETVFLDFARRLVEEEIEYDGPVEVFIRNNPYRCRTK